MEKPTISSYVKEHGVERESRKQPGPFLTISRRFACDGFAIAENVCQKLNEREEQAKWHLHHNDIISRLSEEMGLSEEVIEKERLSKPSLIKDIIRGVRRHHAPDSYEIRNKLGVIMRELAFEGHAIIVGQGSAEATAKMDNGLNIRIEASLEWRIPRVSRLDNLSRESAIAKIKEEDEVRLKLAKYYQEKITRDPLYNLVIDNSVFNVEQSADIIILAMEEKNLIEKGN